MDNFYYKLLTEYNHFMDEIFNDEDDYSPEQEISNRNIKERLTDILENTLGVDEKPFHAVYPDEQFPVVYPVNDSEYLVAPWTNYTQSNFGPRKRNWYSKEYFYRYHVFIYGGECVLLMNLHKIDKLALNTHITKFITMFPFPIKHIVLCTVTKTYDGNKIYMPINKTLSKLIIFNIRNSQFSDGYAKNFPDSIYAIEGARIDNYLDTSKLLPITVNQSAANSCSLWKKTCVNEETFYTLTSKIINMGFTVTDENKQVYTKDNFNYIYSGQQEADRAAVKSKSEQFINDELGEDFIQKLQVTVLARSNRRNNMYLKQINNRRDMKICYDDTIVRMLKDNNIITDPNIARDKKVRGMIMYKMYYILDKNDMFDYKKAYDLHSCIYGAKVYNDWTGDYDNKIYDINDLPIKLNNWYSLYKIYYAIGLAIKQAKGIENLEINELQSYIDRGDGYMEYDEFASELDPSNVEQYHSNITNIDGIDFSYLTYQLNALVNHYYKTIKKADRIRFLEQIQSES